VGLDGEVCGDIENCCDDATVKCVDRVQYVGARRESSAPTTVVLGVILGMGLSRHDSKATFWARLVARPLLVWVSLGAVLVRAYDAIHTRIVTARFKPASGLVVRVARARSLRLRLRINKTRAGRTAIFLGNLRATSVTTVK
jgi:hypothetical protein